MRLRIAALLVAAGTGVALTAQALRPADRTWTTAFVLDPGELVTTGRNPYFILEPGYVLTLEDGKTRLVITVLDETRRIDNVETRVSKYGAFNYDSVYAIARPRARAEVYRIRNAE